MADLNRVFLIGRLTRDPELRYTQNGSPVTNFDLAINRAYTDTSGERKEVTDFIRVVTWRRQAETCSQYLNKGSLVFVEGRIGSRSWETQDGQKRHTTEVTAQRVQFLTPKGQVPESVEGKAEEEQPAPALEEDANIKEPFEPAEEVEGSK